MDGWNTRFLLGWHIFRCYVSRTQAHADFFKTSCHLQKAGELAMSRFSGREKVNFSIFPVKGTPQFSEKDHQILGVRCHKWVKNMDNSILNGHVDSKKILRVFLQHIPRA